MGACPCYCAGDEAAEVTYVGGASARPVLGYFVLTCALSWGLLAVFLGAHGRWGTPAAMPVAVLYMFGPAVAALIFQRRAERPVAELGLSLKPQPSWLVAWILPVVVAAAVFGLGLLLPGVRYDGTMAGFYATLRQSLPAERVAELQAAVAQVSVHPALLATAEALVVGPTVNALVALGEELGWRGYLYEALKGVGFWRASALVGVMWGMWHAPIILLGYNYPQHPQLGVSFMILFCLLWAPLFAWVRQRAGSVGASAVLHGTLNAVAGVPMMVTQGGNDLLVGVTGAVGLAVLAVANLVLFLVFRSGRDRG